MKTLRTIECKLSADGMPDVRVPLYAGVAGEHNVTELVFMGDSGVFADDGEVARISFCGGDGTIVSTDLLTMESDAKGWRVSYALPSFLTVLGGQITARLVLSRIVDGEELQTAISGGVVLFLDDGGMENGTPFWTAVSQMLDGTVQAAKKIEGLLDNFYDGDGGTVYVGSGEAPSDAVVQIDPDGEALVFNPVEKTTDMTVPVGLDATGKLWTRTATAGGSTGMRYRGDASTAEIHNTSDFLVGDVYYNTNERTMYIRIDGAWKAMCNYDEEQVKTWMRAAINAYDTEAMALLGEDGDSE